MGPLQCGQVLKKGDIIRKVQGQDIGDDAKVPFRGARNERPWVAEVVDLDSVPTPHPPRS